MKHLLALLLMLPVAAHATDLPYPDAGGIKQAEPRMQVIQPSDETAKASNTGPASDAEIMQLIDALGVKDSLKASVEASAPLVKQSYNDLLNKTMNEQGLRLSPQQTEALSTRITEKYNKLKTAMFDWMIKEYIRRHKAAYTQLETQQLLNFMQSPVGRKYVRTDSRIWAVVLTEANTQFTKMIPQAVAAAFREAGALR